jgi:tRNA U34 5-carboxymethylaminomethyl modifying enzyme MnmG/GidA
MKDIYGLYYSTTDKFNGVVRSHSANDVCLSSIPKGCEQIALLYFNRDHYSIYCKEYKEYWEWVENRNEERYKNTQSHGKNYDAKNMMHVFRLLEMAIEIAKEGCVNVRRPNRAFLLDIKSGKFEYEELLKLADERQVIMEEAFDRSSLPDKPDFEAVNTLCYEVRKKFYQK